MNLLSKHLPLVTALVLTVPGSAPAWSAEDDDRWFKVEVLVFAQDSAAAAASEFWLPDPELSYPQQHRFIVHPDDVEANLQGYDATSTVDTLGHQTLMIHSPEEDKQTGVGQATPISGPEPAESSGGTTPSEDTEPLTPPTHPTPFTALPANAVEFRGKAAYMQRTGRYQTLFHEAWVQPVASKTRAIPIVLDRSGDEQNWPRLQGSIKLYLSRYLHIETNLWLNTPGSYLPATWQMDEPPLGPQSLFIEYPELLEEEDPAEEPAPEDTPLVYSPEGDEITTDMAPVETGPVYPWRHAIKLAQTRRMRSTEVHYIDHPMMGVVVLVSPITDEELAIMAEEELAGLVAQPAQ